MHKADFRYYTYEQLIDIAFELYEGCERLRRELDAVNNVIR